VADGAAWDDGNRGDENGELLIVTGEWA